MNSNGNQKRKSNFLKSLSILIKQKQRLLTPIIIMSLLGKVGTRYLGIGFPSTKNQFTQASICLTELGRSKILRFASNKNIVGVPKT
jgi:hypothetical protein